MDVRIFIFVLIIAKGVNKSQLKTAQFSSSGTVIQCRLFRAQKIFFRFIYEIDNE